MIGVAVLAIDPPAFIFSAIVGLAFPRWWHVGIAALVIALILETIVAHGAVQFGEDFADNWGRSLAPRTVATLIVAFTAYGLRWLVERNAAKRRGDG